VDFFSETRCTCTWNIARTSRENVRTANVSLLTCYSDSIKSLDYYYNRRRRRHHHHHCHHCHHRCLWHRAQRYLADYCVSVSEVPGRQHLRSARCHQLSVPPVRRSTFGSPCIFCGRNNSVKFTS